MINPTQVCHFGIHINDNPCNKEKGLCIDVNDKMSMNMQSSRIKVRFITIVPTQEELCSFIHVTMTSNVPLEPEHVIMQEVSVSDDHITNCIYEESIKNYHIKIYI